jgi:peptidylprolyl isomerase
MRTLIALTLLAGVASTLAARSTETPAPAEPPAAISQPPAPTPVPVPDGPVVNKQELEGGLIIEDLTIGDGYEVKPGGAVVAYYHGTLKEGGKIFDSAFERGEPVAFPLNGVIPGWQQGVPGMKVGGVRRLTIPAALGYGPQGAGDAIPPNSDLVFTIQLVDALKIEDVKVGEGEEATGQCVAVTTHTITDEAGKEVEKVDASKMYVWLPGELQGVQFGLEGMKVGGKRKISIPKQMNIANPGLPTTRPSGVALTAEVDLIAVRNLPQRRR